MLNLLELSPELVCASADDQVAQAIEVAHNADLNHQLRTPIAERVPHLFQGHEALSALQDAIRDLFEPTAGGGSSPVRDGTSPFRKSKRKGS